MDDAFFVSVFESADELVDQGERLIFGHGTGEVGPFDEFENQSPVLHTVNSGDVRVIELGEELGFTGEAGEALGVGGERVGEDFDGDLAIELAVGGAIDRTHPAFAELASDSIVCDGLLRSQGILLFSSSRKLSRNTTWAAR